MSVDINWQYYCEMTQQSSQISATLSNFPVLLVHTGVTSSSNIPDNIIITENSQSAKSDGSDIRFTTDISGINEIPFEIVYFKQNATLSDARAKIYVKLNSISNVSDTKFYMWWGNSTANAYNNSATFGRNNVWTENYKLVYELNSLQDSTGNLSALSAGGTVSYSTDRFNQSSACRYYTSSTGNDRTPELGFSATNLTFSLWVKRDGLSNTDTGIFFSRNNVNATGINIANYQELRYHWNDTASTYNFNTGISANDQTWNFVSVRITPTSAVYRVNNNEVTNVTTHSSLNFTNSRFYMASDEGFSNRLFKGWLNSIRVANVTRSSQWVDAEYKTESTPYNFITNGVIQSQNNSISKKFNIFISTLGGVLNNPRSFAYTDLTSNKYRSFRYR